MSGWATKNGIFRKIVANARVMSLKTYEVEFVDAQTKLEIRACYYDFFKIVTYLR